MKTSTTTSAAQIRAKEKLTDERHELMLASLDERWWQFRRRWRRRARLAAVERKLGMQWPPW